MLMNYIFCGDHPFNQHVWILYTNRQRKRELRGMETSRVGGRQRKRYIYWSNERQADSTTSVFAVAEPRWKPSDTVQNHCENAVLISQWTECFNRKASSNMRWNCKQSLHLGEIITHELILVFWWIRSPVSPQIRTLNSNTLSLMSTLNISINMKIFYKTLLLLRISFIT
jgi:hypothetical protein